jgi:indole-3-glycerol phosphate synthase
VTTATRPDLLEAIVSATRRSVEVRSARGSRDQLERRAQQRRPEGARFTSDLVRAGAINVIAECKRRSPSRGVLCRAYDPAAIASGYEKAGAVAISVLTEPTFFDGSLDHLEQVRATCTVPLLRKDFIVDEYQLIEAVAAGADAVLLIVAALADRDLAALHASAVRMGLAVLVEVHEVDELDRALAAGAAIVGVNNRNLRTLEVDTAASETIAARIPAGITAVSESGLKTADDLKRLRELGFHAFLIGERFMTTPDPGGALSELLASAQVGRDDVH